MLDAHTKQIRQGLDDWYRAEKLGKDTMKVNRTTMVADGTEPYVTSVVFHVWGLDIERWYGPMDASVYKGELDISGLRLL